MIIKTFNSLPLHIGLHHLIQSCRRFVFCLDSNWQFRREKKLEGNNVWFIRHESESPLAQWSWDHAYMTTNALDDTLKIHDIARPEVSAQYAWSIMQTCVRTNALINAQTSKKNYLQITQNGGDDVCISKASC